jgi:putative transposase
MNDVKSLSHTKWECKYHVTWIPKYRKKEIYGDLRIHLGDWLLRQYGGLGRRHSQPLQGLS